jgi:Zn-dependent alcohol dehydrogenase
MRISQPGHGEVLVRCLAVGAGVTNELARDGSLGGPVPRVHGHELSGEIVTLGPGVCRPVLVTVSVSVMAPSRG